MSVPVPSRRLLLAAPCGFCQGVRGALTAFLKAAASHPGRTIYVLYELVHNRTVTSSMLEQGAKFINSPAEVPEGEVLLLGAHGVGAATIEAARARRLEVIDATCPLVRKLHAAAASQAPDADLVIFGHRDHPEVQGVLGHAAARRKLVIENPDEIAGLPKLRRPLLLTQTTLNYHEAEAAEKALKLRFPDLQCPGGVCTSSRRRQQAVEALAARTDLVIILGSPHSSNANRLREAAERAGTPAVLAERLSDVPRERLAASHDLGLSAGASTPDELIAEACSELRQAGWVVNDGGKTDFTNYFADF